MANSLSKLGSGADNCSLAEWADHLRDLSPSRAQTLRDPLRSCSFRGETIHAVFGYYLGPNDASLVYFWEPDLVRLRWSRLEAGQQQTLSFLALGVALASLQAERPSLSRALAATEDRLLPHLPSGPLQFAGLEICWGEFGETRFACVYGDNEPTKAKSVALPSSSPRLECLAFHHDFLHFRSPLWNSAPMHYLCRNGMQTIVGHVRLHLHPRCFLPWDSGVKDAFLWPWQRCLQGDLKLKEVSYRAIETTSLVFDLRKSTMAMEQLQKYDLGKYSPFLEDVVRAAKNAIFRHGGFFDKETGDGVVGHFVSFGSQECEQPADVRALDAAIDIVLEVAKICECFQDQLTFGIANLGAAIGIHTGDAVWISERNQIRAIGESVVLGARLCSEATVNSIFISNNQFVRYRSTRHATMLETFERKSYKGKESPESVSLYGYELDVFRKQAGA
ncbi:hypothetical protein GFL38_06380 [Rhizobium leguminosarum bv. viciae]|uniref:adenylate/guanylate cyclase domain-containing protein n=1 Tax=Rhizobium ruizarguesonis TaxID=2081791 RepID=UPI00143F6596|nr:adenylate/guanylate cyclase domain-containing protein [Rhizobium ruizarguesonis]NKJ71915.1 hypothetical protein [Rhizobium leguminosarum bv. viciae]